MEVKLHSFLTSALDGGKWLASRPQPLCSQGRNPPPPPLPAGQEAGWTQEPVWTNRRQKRKLCLCRKLKPCRPASFTLAGSVQRGVQRLYSPVLST
jgi:hypothetical protein